MAIISQLFGYILNMLYNLVNNYGIAIIIFTILLRIVLLPLNVKQQKTMSKSSKIQEEIRELQNKYKNNPEKLNQETMELYKRENMSPLSGCLPSIVQLLVILSVFWLVSQPLTYMKKINNNESYNQYKTEIEQSTTKIAYKEISIINKAEKDYKEIQEKLNSDEEIENREELENKLKELQELKLNMNFLGLDISKVPSQSINDWKVYIIPALYVVTTFISMKLTTNMNKKNKKENDEKSETEESMEQMSKTMSLMMPIMSISIAFMAPLGLALYWLVSNITIIIERLLLNKFIINSEEEIENV